MRWLLSVPVWGERYIEVFCATALPALESAVAAMPDHDVRLVVHTDDPRRIRDGATGLNVEVRPVPAGARNFDSMSQAHREVLSMACIDDRVALLTADLVMSRFALARCEQIFQDNQSCHLVACAGVRAVEQGLVPVGVAGADLMAWAWEHRHPMTEECRWPQGRSNDLSRIYFARGNDVVAHLCLPHPLAVRIDGRPLRFNPTVDANLINNFSIGEIHVETDSKVLALVELSPLDKGFQADAEPMAIRFDKAQILFPPGVQSWAVAHKVVLVGAAANCGDDDVMTALLPPNVLSGELG